MVSLSKLLNETSATGIAPPEATAAAACSTTTTTEFYFPPATTTSSVHPLIRIVWIFGWTSVLYLFFLIPVLILLRFSRKANLLAKRIAVKILRICRLRKYAAMFETSVFSDECKV